MTELIPAPDIVRMATPDDIPGLRPILETWIRDSKTNELLTEEVTALLGRITVSAEGRSSRTYVVSEGQQGEVTGIMGMVDPGPDMQPFVTSASPIEFVNAYIDPDHRGEGIGQRLADRLEELARADGHTEIIVNSGPRYKDTGWAFWTKIYGEPVAVQKDLYGPRMDAQVWRKRLH